MSGNVKTQHIQKVVPQTSASGLRRPYLLVALLALLALIVLAHFLAITHTAFPSVVLATCSKLVRNTDYTRIVPFQPRSQEMGAVQLIENVTGGWPAALVPVIETASPHLLDVYIYGCTMQQIPTLTLLFKRQSIAEGQVSVTQAGTISIGEASTILASNSDVSLLPSPHHIYREYSWRDGMFVQTTFPGLYPVISRSEAEVLQEQANNGESFPWSDPLATVKQMAKDLFHWPNEDYRGQIQKNNGITAQILLKRQEVPIEVTVTLSRLIQENSLGLWFVTAAKTPDITINLPTRPAPLSSPIAFQGVVNTPGKITTMLFDHTLTPLQVLNNPTVQVRADGTYTGIIYYANPLPNQPGVLLITQTVAPDTSTSPQLLLTGVLLG